LFSESLTRFIVEVAVDHMAAFEEAFRGLLLQRLGLVRDNGKLSVRSQGTVMFWQMSDLEAAWRGETAAEDNSVNVGARRAVPLHDPRSVTRVANAHAAPRVLVLHANGTNRDRDAALAC